MPLDTHAVPSVFDSVGNPSYIGLRTFRRSGVPVETPVWMARDGGRLFVMTGGTSGKVKRIRNNPQVEVCAADMRGRPKGPWVPAMARIVDEPAAVAQAMGLLRRKYGIQFRLAGLMSRGGSSDTVLEITGIA